jgi:transposase-like protein
MTVYPEDQKRQLIEQMLPPQSRPVPEIYQATGIPKDTLYGWRRQALEKQGQTVPASGRGERRWSGQEKFAMVVEAMAMNETERAAYCRQRGLYPEQLQAWQHACEQANGAGKGKPRGVNDIQAERRRTRELERELTRKDKALAETAALLVLRKKARAIWGTGEDE